MWWPPVGSRHPPRSGSEANFNSGGDVVVDGINSSQMGKKDIFRFARLSKDAFFLMSSGSVNPDLDLEVPLLSICE